MVRKRHRSRSRSSKRAKERKRERKRDDAEDARKVCDPTPEKVRDAVPRSHESWGRQDAVEKVEETDEIEKEEANFEVTGLLAMEDNSKNGVALKFTEPPDACEPTSKWRFYIFKKSEEKKVIHLHRKAGFLFGKDRRVVDIPTDHPTCSKQHAVLFFRQRGTDIIPYLMDLESTNGSFVNGKQIEPARYVEVRDKDVIRFASSSRELVLINAEKPK